MIFNSQNVCFYFCTIDTEQSPGRRSNRPVTTIFSLTELMNEWVLSSNDLQAPTFPLHYVIDMVSSEALSCLMAFYTDWHIPVVKLSSSIGFASIVSGLFVLTVLLIAERNYPSTCFSATPTNVIGLFTDVFNHLPLSTTCFGVIHTICRQVKRVWCNKMPLPWENTAWC